MQQHLQAPELRVRCSAQYHEMVAEGDSGDIAFVSKHMERRVMSSASSSASNCKGSWCRRAAGGQQGPAVMPVLLLLMLAHVTGCS